MEDRVDAKDGEIALVNGQLEAESEKCRQLGKRLRGLRQEGVTAAQTGPKGRAAQNYKPYTLNPKP